MRSIPIKRYLTLLGTYLKPQWLKALLLALVLLVGTVLQLINPQLVRYFIDTISVHGDVRTLVNTGLLYVGVAVVNQGVAIVTSYLSTNVAWTATNQLRVDLVKHCLALDMSFHKAHTAGEMIERIDGDVDDLSNFFSQFVLSLLTNALLLVGILFLFFTISWIVGLAMTAFSLLVFLALLYMRRYITQFWKAERQMSAVFYGFLGERLGGTEDIRANGATASIMRRFYLLLREWFPIRRRAVMASNFAAAFTLFMFVCGSALALLLGTYLWSLKQISIGTVYLLFAYTDLLSQPTQQIQAQLQDLQQAEACIQRTEEILKISSKLADNGTEPFPIEARDKSVLVEFKDVTFGYSEDEPVIQNLTFTIQPGRILGIVGRTGGGKTTIARLLFRLYDPQSGEIRIGGIATQKVPLHELRQHIGMVTQDVQLFHASVRDNLTFFTSTIHDEHILAAIDEVGLTKWYKSLPDGLDTVLGSDGEGLSAGEAQLLAFTRVLLTQPGLVILDEASARLDPATEGIIEKAIGRLFAQRTAIVIAHRLATIQRVDDILIIEDGQAVEYGRREELMRDAHSRFAGILRVGLEEMRV